MNSRNISGFTLIELMIVLAIVSIITAVSMGFYGDYVTRANRTDARIALTETSASLEKCKSLYANYNSANCNVIFPVISENGFYSIAPPAATPITGATFTLTATPVDGERQATDADCTSLTLTHTGIKDGAGDDVSSCW